jgi:hypothetical protein
MRQIEKDMLRAINARENWRKDNTEVKCVPAFVGFGESAPIQSEIEVLLHGNHIATVSDGTVKPNRDTLAAWPTPTTKSRLRALGVNVTQKAGAVAIDGEIVCHV